MNSNQILITILVIITADYLLEQLLSYFNIKSNKTEVPDSMKEYYDKEKYAKSQEYLKVQTRFSYLTSGLSFVIAFILLFFGLFGWLDQIIDPYFDSPILLALAFFGILFLASDFLGTPFSWYSIFIIEERFGFNKTTPKLFFVPDRRRPRNRFFVACCISTVSSMTVLARHSGPPRNWIRSLPWPTGARR